ncbi:MAG TPA: CapA family protein [Gemmatimonadales bacterium]|nr:CapA family protein [Gemmatimonadales bacterium]
MSRPLKLGFAGDVMLGRLVNESLAGGDYARPWGDTLASLRALDLFFVNLECALTARTERWPDGGNKPFYFRADPAAVRTLTLGRVAFASLANNHIGDFGPEGLRDTIAALDGAGIAHGGAGIDGMSVREPALLTTDATRVAVLAFADYPAEWAATAAAPGINYTPISLAHEDFDEVRVAVAVAREQADVVVFSIHWGPNMSEHPTPAFRDFAHAVVDAGADIFWGHSAHVPQGVELRNGRLILYDTGDFVDDYAVDERLRNDLSALFVVQLAPTGVDSVEVVPVQIADMQARLAHGPEREWFVERFGARCAELGTKITAEPGKLRVGLPVLTR